MYTFTCTNKHSEMYNNKKKLRKYTYFISIYIQ